MEPQVNDAVTIDVNAFLRDPKVLGSFKSCSDLLRDDRAFLVEAVSGDHVAISTGFRCALYAPIPTRHVTVDWRPKYKAGDVVMLTRNPDFTAAHGWKGFEAVLHCGRLLRILRPDPGRAGDQVYDVHTVGNQHYSSISEEVHTGSNDYVFVFRERSMLLPDDTEGVRLWLECIDKDRAEWWQSDPPRLSREKAELILYGEKYKPEERRSDGLWTCSRHHKEVPDRVPALYKNTSGYVTSL